MTDAALVELRDRRRDAYRHAVNETAKALAWAIELGRSLDMRADDITADVRVAMARIAADVDRATRTDPTEPTDR